jgi:hypothetical protein
VKVGDLVVVRPGTDDPRLPDNRMGVIILGWLARSGVQQKEITEGCGFDTAKILFNNGEIMMFHTDYLAVVDKK